MGRREAAGHGEAGLLAAVLRLAHVGVAESLEVDFLNHHPFTNEQYKQNNKWDYLHNIIHLLYSHLDLVGSSLNVGVVDLIAHHG